jgi:hypothetical protein
LSISAAFVAFQNPGSEVAESGVERVRRAPTLQGMLPCRNQRGSGWSNGQVKDQQLTVLITTSNDHVRLWIRWRWVSPPLKNERLRWFLPLPTALLPTIHLLPLYVPRYLLEIHRMQWLPQYQQKKKKYANKLLTLFCTLESLCCSQHCVALCSGLDQLSPPSRIF